MKVISCTSERTVVRDGYNRSTLLNEELKFGSCIVNVGLFYVEVPIDGAVLPHRHNYDYEIFYFLDPCFVGDERNQFTVAPGEAVLIGPGETHWVRPKPGCGVRFTTFRIPCNLADRTLVDIKKSEKTLGNDQRKSPLSPLSHEKRSKVRDAIVGGYGFLEFVEDPEILTPTTPFGRSPEIAIGQIGGTLVAIVNRHGRGHETPPHKINYKAYLWALKQLGVERIFAYAAVGSLRRNLDRGKIVLPHDFIDFSVFRQTFFEGGNLRSIAHVDMKKPFCPEVRNQLVKTAHENGIPVEDHGVYICTEGPRFETPAEVRMFRRLGGDVVGMTVVREATLAREASLCYGVLAVVTNYGCGISSSNVSYKDITNIMQTNLPKIKSIFEKAVQLKPHRPCECQSLLSSHGMLIPTLNQPAHTEKKGAQQQK